MFFFKLKVVATWGGEGEFDLPKIESLFFWGGGGGGEVQHFLLERGG